MAKTYTTSEIAELLQRVSNWGRWGLDDQRGALNYISNEKRAAAARLARTGETVSLALPLATCPARDNPAPVTHLMIRSGNVGHPLGSWGCADYFAIEPHGLATTHLDALCHHFYQGKMYNGFDYTEVDFQGAHKCAIDVARDGIISRGYCSISRASGKWNGWSRAMPYFPKILKVPSAPSVSKWGKAT